MLGALCPGKRFKIRGVQDERARPSGDGENDFSEYRGQEWTTRGGVSAEQHDEALDVRADCSGCSEDRGVVFQWKSGDRADLSFGQSRGQDRRKRVCAGAL